MIFHRTYYTHHMTHGFFFFHFPFTFLFSFYMGKLCFICRYIRKYKDGSYNTLYCKHWYKIANKIKISMYFSSLNEFNGFELSFPIEIYFYKLNQKICELTEVLNILLLFYLSRVQWKIYKINKVKIYTVYFLSKMFAKA